ncbi:MAG: DegT/DnrJ/EryC1/StrS family aminotransferase [Actinobacteria bacterium]|nr:DegT/DnrJ/EryC1/StrS family aminotransferase [Actinomycetota bacterium]
MITISKIKFDRSEVKSILKVIKSGSVTQGERVEEFENDNDKYIDSKYAVATSSGTSALFLSLLALGIGAGDEVITTPFSFIASSNAILYTGAKPVFIDINEKTFNIDASLIEKKINNKTRAILPVHLYGLSCDMESIKAIAKRNKLFVIEDACQAHGALFKNRKVGTFGDLGCFSFYATKNMTTIEGGMITTNNKKLYEKLKLLRNHGSKVKYHHDILGYNYRMTDLSAAIGLEQLRKLPKFNKARIRNANYLSKYLSKIKEIEVPFVPSEFTHVFHQYTIRFNNFSKRIKIIEALDKKGIKTEVYYPTPIHKQKIYKSLGYLDRLPVAERVSKSVLSLPVHPYLNKKDLDRIIFEISSAIS